MKISLKKKKRGFTLIELLVVIAIIGILASIVLVSLGGARARAKDARIIADMGQLRTAASIIEQNDGNFDNIDCTKGDIKTLCDDIASQGGTKPSNGSPGIDIYKPASPAGSYCAEVKLNLGKFYCVDSSLTSKDYTSNPSCGAVGDYTCD